MSFATFLFLFTILFSFHHSTIVVDCTNLTCLPSPAPAPSLLPECFASKRIETAYHAIQEFKETVQYDPHNVMLTWHGCRVCEDNAGIFCDAFITDNETAVTRIDLNGFGLAGSSSNGLSLDIFMRGIQELNFMHLNSNNFTGSIPNSIKDLEFFFELDVSNNKLSGGFPNVVLEAKELTFLDIRFNCFGGHLPAALFESNLDMLFLNNNKFSGKIPKNIGSTKARVLSFSNNFLTGSVPQSIGDASRTIEEAVFLNNRLTGCLPYQIGLLGSATVFDVELNQLTGPIPQSLSCLQSMKLLNLGQNQFYGPIPDNICILPNLTSFNVSTNYFTGIGPNCRKLVCDGVLDVDHNCIPGLPCQRPEVDCRKFLLKVTKKPPCQNMGSMSKVPCGKSKNKTIAHRNSEEKMDGTKMGFRGSPKFAPSYAALDPEWRCARTHRDSLKHGLSL